MIRERDSFFIVVFILELLEAIIMYQFLFVLGLVASGVVMERATKSFKMLEKTATKDQQTTRNNIRPKVS